MFNHGVTEVEDALKENGNPPAVFNIDLVTAFSVIIRDEEKTYEESIENVNLNIACTQLKPQLKPEYNLLLNSLLEDILPLSEIKLKPQLKPLYGNKSNTLIKDKLIHPMMDLGLVEQTHPDKPTSPNQKYYLTELGKALQRFLLKNDNRSE